MAELPTRKGKADTATVLLMGVMAVPQKGRESDALQSKVGDDG